MLSINTVSVLHNTQNEFIILQPGRSSQTYPSTGTVEETKVLGRELGFTAIVAGLFLPMMGPSFTMNPVAFMFSRTIFAQL